MLKNNQHGMTLLELGLKNGDILTAEKLPLSEDIVQAPITDVKTQWLTPRAEEIFKEWY